MRQIIKTVMILILAFGFSTAIAANTNDATAVLFGLLDKGGCNSNSLVGRSWTISTSPVGTHGELILGDTLEFELLGASTGISKKGAIQIRRNGIVWQSATGWVGQCIRDGRLSQYVVSGDVDIDGCLHDLAIGRLDHDDNLSNKIELVFQDSGEAAACEEFVILHPGHAHGVD
jgi:hypothetical protein